MESDRNTIVVTIGIFSGRPNPEIVLEGQSAEEFANLLRTSIGKQPIHPPPPPKLGYFYGFFVKVPPQLAKEMNIPSEFTVYNSIVSEGEQNKMNHWQEQDRIENFLFDQAYDQGYGELFNKVNFDRNFTPPLRSK